MMTKLVKVIQIMQDIDISDLYFQIIIPKVSKTFEAYFQSLGPLLYTFEYLHSIWNDFESLLF